MTKASKRPEPEGQAATPTPPDQAARDLITRDLDRNLLVEAAAGTGKTTSLVGRMISLIREGRCKIDKLAAVTFTRKAAAELRGRFQLALENAARQATGTEQERLTRAVDHIESAFLGTIHSFCGRLLRERPVEAGVDPEFIELDDEQDAELRRRAWSEHVARLIDEGDPLVATLEDLGVDILTLLSTFERFADFPDVALWPVDKIDLPEAAPLIGAVREYARHMEALAPALPDDFGNDKLMPYYRRVPRLVRQADLSRPGDLYALLEPFVKSTPSVVQKNWPGGKAQAKAEQDAWNQFAQTHAIGYIEASRAFRYKHVLAALRPAVKVYDRLRREAGGLNFQDLLLLAARMLRDNPPIRRYFRGRFTHLLVDEFQDTDPIQAEVMLLLTADDARERNWRRCKPVSGSLFVVGDPKQSIYRFRRADIVTYNEVKHKIAATGGVVVSLTANFRTTAPLLEWLNETFAKRFPAEATEVAPAHAPFLAGRVDDKPGDFAGLYLLDAAGTNREEILGHECAVVARTIRHALSAERTALRSRRESDMPEVARASDFLIVTRNTKNLSRYARELEALGVPHQVTGGTSLNELEELRLLCTCLRALARPDDPVALVAALRSALFGISDAALYAFKRSGGRFSFHSKIPEDGVSRDDREAIKDAFDRLQLYYRWLGLLPPAASVEKIAAHLGLFGRAVAGPGGDVRAGSLAKVVELVRSVQTEQLSALDLVAYLERLVEPDDKHRHDGIAVRPPGTAVVRLMNLHKVKGLEARTVFLSDPTGKFEHPVDVHIDRSGEVARGYMAVYEPRPEVGYKPAALLACPLEWSQLAAREEEFQQAENERLLYVAATRAGTCLIVSRREKKVATNPWQPLCEALSDQGTHQDPGPQPPPVRPRVTVTAADVDAAKTAIDERFAVVRGATYETERMKEVSLRRSRMPGDRDASAPPLARSDEDGAVADPTAAGEHGVEWGEDVHALLEAAMRKPDADIESLARSLTRDRELGDERVTALLATVRAVRQSAIWNRAHASERVLAEVPLMMVPPPAESVAGRSTVRRGVIDLAFREPEGWVIVDYKTDTFDRRSISELVEHYRPQVESYAEAWRTIVGEPVHEVGLFFTSANRYERLSGKGSSQ